MATATSTELTNEQWKLIEPLLPGKASTGRPRADDRNTLNGILWVLRTGARWADIPRQYGASSTCHDRLQSWQSLRIWEEIWRHALTGLDKEGKINWQVGHIDGSFVPAKKGEKPSE
jgi:transposase